MSDLEDQKCSCGNRAGDSFIEKDRSYSLWGWFLLYFGISTTPRKLTYRCTICRESIWVESDYFIIKKTYRDS